jgi:hypothetical protein
MGGCLPGCCGCPCARGGLGWAGLGLLAHTEVVILSLTCTSVERSDHPDVPRQERRHSRLAAQFGVHGRSGSEPSLRPNSRGSSASVACAVHDHLSLAGCLAPLPCLHPAPDRAALGHPQPAVERGVFVS